jgi:hypothetical protein
MKDIFHATWIIVFFVAKMLGKALIWIAVKFIGRPGETANSAASAPSDWQLTEKQVKQAVQEGTRSVPVTLQKAEFDVADRIVSIRLEPALGVINLRLYMAKQLVQGDLIIHEPELKKRMGGRLHRLSNVNFTSYTEIDTLRETAIEQATSLINEKGREKTSAQGSLAKPAKPVARALERKAETVTMSRPVDAEALPSQPVVKLPAAKQAMHDNTSGSTRFGSASLQHAKVFRPVAQAGITYVGRLKSFGHRRQTRPDKTSYEVFEAVLTLDNGAELPLRGAELERELRGCGVIQGEFVSITPTGKVPVTLHNGDQGAKNLYRVERMGTT